MAMICVSFATMAHLAEGQCVGALLTPKVEDSLSFLVGTRMPTVSVMEWQFSLPLKQEINIGMQSSGIMCSEI
jgi:hypothetical protein